ncbi:aldo/keto reductase [Pararhizobium sp. IMCC21322]|uniref:aldo/keto reductase n=1 Tax=Pararhizobium sp. IMCC21322 TaxID=3067903 RepID=UPI0027419A55|nr:aldo/keto reductase [Pararhizobium sp. IMCC21322]
MAIDLPQLGFGGAPIGGLLDPVDDAAALDAVSAALECGIRYFDTAPFYGFGLSERRLGDVVRGADDIIISTKVGRLLKPGLPGDPAAFGWPNPLPFHPQFDYGYAAVMRSFEDSLQRLGRDHVDILFLHDIGPFTHTDPDEETRHFKDAMSGGYKALDELRRAGNIKAIGIGVNEIDVSMRALDHGDWDVFLLAGRYTLLEQHALGEFLPKCAAKSVRIIIGGPFNSGILVGGTTWNYETAPAEIVNRVKGLTEVCTAHNVPLPAAALKFPLAHSSVSSVIPGVRTPEEFSQLMDWWKTDIPAALWTDMKSAGLIREDAPLPVS